MKIFTILFILILGTSCTYHKEKKVLIKKLHNPNLKVKPKVPTEEKIEKPKKELKNLKERRIIPTEKEQQCWPLWRD